MKQSLTVAIAALLGTGALFFWKKSSVPTHKSHMVSVEAPKKAKDVFGKVPVSRPLAVIAPSEIPAVCRDFWDFLSSQSLERLNGLLSRGELKWDENCLKSSEPSQAQAVQAQCLTAFNEKECREVLALYRAEVIASFFANEKDLSKLDSSVLMNMIMAKFAGSRLGPEELAEIKNYAQVLMQKEPGLYAAEKSYAGALFIESLQDQHASRELREESARAMQKLREMNPNDLEVIEMSIVPDLLKGDFDKGRELASEMERSRPESGLPHYYRGAIYWREKNKTMALVELKRALEKEPENSRYRDTYTKAMMSQPTDSGIFNVSLSVGFSDS